MIDDMISLWHTSRDVVETFIEQANKHHPTIKFTAEICTDATFLDTTIYKGERFNKESVLDARTHFKPMETFQYTFFTTSPLPGAKKGFVKGEALRLLRTNSSIKTYSRKNSLKFPRFILRAKFGKDRNLHIMAVFAV